MMHATDVFLHHNWHVASVSKYRHVAEISTNGVGLEVRETGHTCTIDYNKFKMKTTKSRNPGST